MSASGLHLPVLLATAVVVAARGLRRRGAAATVVAVRPTAHAHRRRLRPVGPARWAGSRRRARDERRVEQQWPAVSESLARSLRSGRTLPDALAAAGGSAPPPLSQRMAPVLQRLAVGMPMSEAVHPWRLPGAGPEAAAMAVLLCLGAELGAGTSPAFEAMAAAQRDRLDVAAEVRSLTAQAQSSARLLTALPLLAALGLGLVQPATLTFLLGQPAGWACTTLAAALDAAGWWWMRSLTGAVG